MIPINDLRADAELTLEELNRRLIEVTTKQDELDELSLHLTERLDELSDRESKCKDLETTLNLRKIGIDSEAEQISNGHTRLNGQIKDFMVTLETKTKELVVKEESLNIEKKRVQEYLELRTKELDEEKKGLADKRAALEREFNRLNNK
jgi:predicted  nucleic acid-binding Zn-ribbon protein